jgi:hypothetical protein
MPSPSWIVGVYHSPICGFLNYFLFAFVTCPACPRRGT